MYFRFINVFLLDIFQASYFYSSGLCGHNRYPANGISDSKAIALSIINAHYFLHFIGTMIFVCMVTIPINNIANLISATISE